MQGTAILQFQFLIGKILTFLGGIIAYLVALFQFLIGKILTNN